MGFHVGWQAQRVVFTFGLVVSGCVTRPVPLWTSLPSGLTTDVQVSPDTCVLLHCRKPFEFLA